MEFQSWLLKKLRRMRVSELCKFLNLSFFGFDFEISGVCSLSNQKDFCLTFNKSDTVPTIKVKHLAVLSKLEPNGGVWIKSSNPQTDFIRACNLFLPKIKLSGIHPTAIIHPGAKVKGDSVYIAPYVVIDEDAEIDEGCMVYAHVYVGKSVKIGKNTILLPGAKIMNNCEIGSNCVIGPGTVIGGDGFGYVLHNGEFLKFPQIGRVIIEDFVEIGANVTIDRGALDDTIIKRGTKIDNLVQIGHNVEIGENTLICGQAGIAGSAKIGSYCVLGGQAGVRDHVRITDFVRIAGKSGVLNSILEKGDFMNVFPPMEANKWKRFIAFLIRNFKKTINKYSI